MGDYVGVVVGQEIAQTRQLLLAGYLNEATKPAKPVVEMHFTNRSCGLLKQELGDINSKTRTLSCAVEVFPLEMLLEPEIVKLIGAQLALADSLGEEAGNAMRRMIDGLLSAGARMALITPDIEYLVPQRSE